MADDGMAMQGAEAKGHHQKKYVNDYFSWNISASLREGLNNFLFLKQNFRDILKKNTNKVAHNA